MVNLTKPRMESILVMYRNTVRVQKSKETSRFNGIVTFERLGGYSDNGMAV